MKSWLAGIMLFVAIAAWTGYAGLIYMLSQERIAYTETVARVEEEEFRGERAARVRTSVQSTVAGRAALEELVNITLLQAIEVIEQAGAAAGMQDASIGAATPASAPEGMTAYTFVVDGTGSFGSVMRAVMLLETLPIPAALEEFHLGRDERESSWRLSAKVRVLIAARQTL